VTEEILHLVMGGAVKEDFFNQEFQGKADHQGDQRGKTDIPDRFFEAFAADKEGVQPRLPEIEDDGEHRSGVEHHQQESHRGTGWVETHQLLGDDDVRGTGDGE
jgi:hypothetical protein